MVTLVTTMNRRLYDEYGQRMAQSFETCASGVRLGRAPAGGVRG